MNTKRFEHFLIFVPLMAVNFGALYGAGFGTFGILFDYVFIEARQSDYPQDMFWIIACLPLKIGIGLGVGILAGVIMSVCDSILISSITLKFIKTGKLWIQQKTYHHIARLGCILVNCFIGVLLFPPSTTWLTIPLIFSATILGINHFLDWYLLHMMQKPQLFFELAGVYSKRSANSTIWDEIHDLITYQMSEIPKNLTQYADGELPADLLRQFPIDSNRK